MTAKIADATLAGFEISKILTEAKVPCEGKLMESVGTLAGSLAEVTEAVENLDAALKLISRCLEDGRVKDAKEGIRLCGDVTTDLLKDQDKVVAAIIGHVLSKIQKAAEE